MAIGVGREGILDPQSGRSVRIMLLLLSPADPPESHLAALGAISRMARNDRWRKDALSAKESGQIQGLIHDWEEGFN